MKKSSALALLGLFLLVGPAAAIQFSQDFDSGSLDIAATTIVDNTVYLVGRKTWTSSSKFRWFYFKASDVEGLQPLFGFDRFDFSGDIRDHRFLYSYDQAQWHYFDHCYYSGRDYRFENNQPFTQDEVYIAYSLPYPLSRTHQHMAAVAESPYVYPTTSGQGALVIGQSPGGTDDLGRTIAPNDLYGFKIADFGVSGNKAKVLLTGGNHPCETPGNYALEGMIDFLLGDAPEAVGLRRLAEFYVYPQMNPDGRIAGYWRSTVENPAKDYNRYWNNPTGLTDMTVVRDAMILDTGGEVDYLLDFHSMFGAWTRPPYYEVIPDDADSPLALALAQLEPGIRQSLSDGHPGMLRIWGQSAAGLSAEHSYTPEFGCHPGVLEQRLDQMGANYARALYCALVAELNRIPGDATGDGMVDQADAGRLASNWGATPATWAMGDFDSDSIVGPGDAAILAAHWGYVIPVPEPTVIAMLLGLPLALLLRRRR